MYRFNIPFDKERPAPAPTAHPLLERQKHSTREPHFPRCHKICMEGVRSGMHCDLDGYGRHHMVRTSKAQDDADTYENPAPVRLSRIVENGGEGIPASVGEQHDECDQQRDHTEQ